MKTPEFGRRDLEFATSEAIFLRGQKLFESKKVKEIREHGNFYSGVVRGTEPYFVKISKKSVEASECSCFMGENGDFCKHIVALGLAVLDASGKIEPEFISPENLDDAKMQIRAGLKKIRAYSGSSSIWFRYQKDLDAGSRIIESAISNLPASAETAKFLWKLVVKLSNKLARGGIDDSDGRVGACIDEIVHKCAEFAKKDDSLRELIAKFDDDTGFGFEDDLRDLIAE